jgi:RNA polymerase sporulation-specific sigma factor
VAKEDIALALESTNYVESIESATYINHKDGNSISLIETIATDKNEAEIITNKIAINELIEDLEKREKQVILLRFYKEKTQSEVAKILGITQVQVSRIERRVLENMRIKLLPSA